MTGVDAIVSMASLAAPPRIAKAVNGRTSGFVIRLSRPIQLRFPFAPALRTRDGSNRWKKSSAMPSSGSGASVDASRIRNHSRLSHSPCTTTGACFGLKLVWPMDMDFVCQTVFVKSNRYPKPLKSKYSTEREPPFSSALITTPIDAAQNKK